MGQRTTLLVNGHIHSSNAPDATAMATANGAVLWLGQSEAGRTLYPDAEIVDLEGAFVTPGLVDAHVHATATGLHLTGLDLSAVRDAGELLAAIRTASHNLTKNHAESHPDDVLVAHGWDESTWTTPRIPSRTELDEAAGGRAVYLSRVDVHSALVTTALIDRTPHTRTAQGWSEDGPITRDAHHEIRIAVRQATTQSQRRQAQLAFFREAAQNGITSVHECAGPDISSEQDFTELLALSQQAGHSEVLGYWGEFGAVDKAHKLGAIGLAGDLFVDGALGSRTAALCAPYQDAPTTQGTLYLTAEKIAEHLILCTEAGLQAGFHVIGDAAIGEVVEGFQRAENHVGRRALVGRHHRLEHVEMVTAEQAATLANWGVSASMQPQFDAAWGGPAGMYVERLGQERAVELNPFALLAKAGIPLAFGSDSPVTPMNPWASIRAAMHHHTPHARISARAAFTAHTRGGHRAAGNRHETAGGLLPGAPADYAIWSVQALEVASSDARTHRWSTDPRSGVPPLPRLDPDTPLPQCLRTVRAGRVIYDQLTSAA